MNGRKDVLYVWKFLTVTTRYFSLYLYDYKLDNEGFEFLLDEFFFKNYIKAWEPHQPGETYLNEYYMP